MGSGVVWGSYYLAPRSADRAFPRIMLHDTPLRNQHQQWIEILDAAERPAAHAHRPGAAIGRRAAPAGAGGASGADGASGGNAFRAIDWLPYGPLDAEGRPTCEIVAHYGAVEAEYAAIRRGAALLDAPHRGVLRIDGRERREFLNRMLTQELKDLEPGMCRESFWLNRKGRIDADLLVVALGDRMLADIDVQQAAGVAPTLSEYIFSEEVAVVDDSRSWHRLSLHGPRAPLALAGAAGLSEWTITNHMVATVVVGGVETIVARRDQVGEIGLELFMPRDGAVQVWEALVGRDPEGRPRSRPIGWHAFNVARIEAGAALFNIDFDTTCLPHETSLLATRVSFTKGCYLGQEIVARMHSLGRPKRRLVGLHVRAHDPHGPNGAHGPGHAVLPEAGGNVHAIDAGGEAARTAAGESSGGGSGASGDLVLGEPVGQVTSSTYSPMLGAAAIAFAMIKSSHAEEGTLVAVASEGERAIAVVGPLRSWPTAAVVAAGAERAKGSTT